MDDFLCDYSSAHDADLASNPGIKFPQSQFGFFEKLEPLDGAIEVVNLLIAADEYEPYILTAPSNSKNDCHCLHRDARVPASSPPPQNIAISLQRTCFVICP